MSAGNLGGGGLNSFSGPKFPPREGGQDPLGEKALKFL